MLYITRFQYKEFVKAGDLAEINKLLDMGIIPAVEKVEGMRSAQAYNSIAGEVVFLLDMEDMATVDRILADPGCKAVLGKAMDWFVRSAGEVLFDRPRWQGLYQGS